MNTNCLKPFLLIAFACMSIIATAYDFMADGLAYLVNDDGMTATVTYLERRNAANYSDLTTVVIPSQVTNPADGKLYTVTTIGESAFYSNKTITSITVPPTITRMEKDAFGTSMPSKTVVHISDLASWCAIDFENAGANPLYNMIPLYLNGEMVTDLVIPKGINKINRFAFIRCKSITSLTIEADVPAIESEAFRQCTGLTRADIMGNVVTIDSSAFQLCSKLESISLPASVDTLGPSVFASCTSLTSFDCPPQVRTITRNAFRGCTQLATVTLGPKVEIIGSTAFSQCKNLTSINYPQGLRAIGSNAFNGCALLASADLPISCSDVRHNAFLGTKWLNDQPDGVAYAGFVAYAFKGTMPDAYHLQLRDSIVGIAQYAFYNQKSLEKVTLPFTMFDLGGWSFSNCSNLKEVHCKMKAPRYTASQYNLYGGWAVFLGVNLSEAKLYVPVGCKNAYATSVWNQFGEIIEEGFIVGDATGDNKVDVEDVNAIINVILKAASPEEYIGKVDVNSDGKVDVEDVNGVINLILGLSFFNE